MQFFQKLSDLFRGKSEEPSGQPAKTAPAAGITTAVKVDGDQVEDVVYNESGEVFLPPCQIGCPIGADIQRSHVMLANILASDEEVSVKQIEEVGDLIYGKNPLFPICGYVCGICEKDCNYEDETGSVRRRLLERFVGDNYLPILDKKPTMPKPTKEKVAVIGAGPSGLVCAYQLSQKGYQVTIFEKRNDLGGALRYIPVYRLPQKVLDDATKNLVRIANIEVKYGTKIGSEGNTLEDLRKQGYEAFFIAAGKPIIRQLTFNWQILDGMDLEGCGYGLRFLSDANRDKAENYEGKKVLVVGGGNVAFDVARTAKRLGADVSVVCLEASDKSSRDGIPADIEEVEGAEQEGIKIHYSRGVEEIVGDNGKFAKIKCPKCTTLFDEKGFNPKFDTDDVIELEGDMFLVAIGQASDHSLFYKEGLYNDDDRIDMDTLTLKSNRRKGVFIGGDVWKVGFAAEAIRDGAIAAESIDRYIRDVDLKKGRGNLKKGAAIPRTTTFKRQPDLVWLSPEQRLNFDLFENGFSESEAIEEAKRCLYCGPCKSCKACLLLELQAEIYDIDVNLDVCGRCGVCVAICPYEAPSMITIDEEIDLVIDVLSIRGAKHDHD